MRLIALLILLSSFIILDVAGLPFVTNSVLAEEKKTRKTPALRERVYSQLARAQNLADEGQVEEGMAILNTIKGRQSQMNEYEIAMLWNFIGFIEYSQENVAEAIEAFENVIAQDAIPESLEMSTLFSLAQLSMSLEQYSNTIAYLDRWESLATDKTSRSSAFNLRANALYANKQYDAALSAIEGAIADLKEGKLPEESWLVLKRALHYELKQTRKVTETTELLVKHYSKPKYWVELANLYGELGEDELHLAVLEAAYQQGYVEKSTDVQTLAQLYFYSGAPFKAASLLEKEINNDVIRPDLKIYTFLAQSWEAAKELDKAIASLQEAIGLTNDHALLQKIARLYIDLERWNEALEYATKAENIIEHIKEPGNIYVVKGIALLNLKRFNESISAFKQAREINETKRIANQWLKFVERESEIYRSTQLDEELSD